VFCIIEGKFHEFLNIPFNIDNNYNHMLAATENSWSL